MDKYLGIILIIIVLSGCGGPEGMESRPDNPPEISAPEPQNLPACFQKTNSPSYPEGVDLLTHYPDPSQLTNSELQACAGVYQCLWKENKITEDEYQCLLDDISNLRIVVSRGLKEKGSFECGSNGACAGAGCINDNVIILNPLRSTLDTVRHECCHRASHLTLGIRGHPANGWWIEDINDCICEKVFL